MCSCKCANGRRRVGAIGTCSNSIAARLRGLSREISRGTRRQGKRIKQARRTARADGGAEMVTNGNMMIANDSKRQGIRRRRRGKPEIGSLREFSRTNGSRTRGKPTAARRSGAARTGGKRYYAILADGLRLSIIRRTDRPSGSRALKVAGRAEIPTGGTRRKRRFVPLIYHQFTTDRRKSK